MLVRREHSGREELERRLAARLDSIRYEVHGRSRGVTAISLPRAHRNEQNHRCGNVVASQRASGDYNKFREFFRVRISDIDRAAAIMVRERILFWSCTISGIICF